jgi:hypothetical protein
MSALGGLGRLALLVAAMALATVALGWWGVAVAAAAFAVIDRRSGTPLEAAAAAGLAWGLLLIVAEVRGEAGGAARAVGGAVGIPPLTLFVITLVFPIALAWSCAMASRVIAGLAVGGRSTNDAARG